MRVIFTGGGTLGHVVPNLAVIEEFTKRSRKHSLMYIGAKKGVEKEAVTKWASSAGVAVVAGQAAGGDRAAGGIEICEISCGKLRRYFSWQNFIDFFKVLFGMVQAAGLVRRFEPHVVFSKGGFVTVPVVLTCGVLNFGRRVMGRERIRVVVHESDVEIGLANKIGAKFADKVLCGFEETKKFFRERSRGKVEVVGSPVRAEIFKGVREAGLKLCGFNRFKPVVLVMGGSQGAKQVNKLVWGNLGELLKKYQIVHIVGKGNLDFGLHKDGYKQFELLFGELKDVYAACDLVVSRGGANSLAEIAALGKKAVIVPLGRGASRGDQIVNAKVCSEEYGWQVLYDEVSDEQFVRAIEVAEGDSFKGEGVLHRKAAGRIVDMLMEI